MRSLLILSAIVAAIVAATVSAQAERRIFIIAGDAGGYGVDRCLATGAKCGVAMATAYCKSRKFKRAVSFRKVARGEITGGVPLDAYACSGHKCKDFIAIECAR